jgi:hypothetical protein
MKLPISNAFMKKAGQVKNQVLIILCFLLANYSLAADNDTLILRSDQVLIGELISINLGVIEFDEKELSIIKVKYHKIKSLSAEMNNYKIETSDKKIFFGKIKASKNFGEIIVVDDTGDHFYQLSNIVRLTKIEESFTRKLSGTVSAGLSYTKSSSVGRWNYDNKILYNSNRFSSVLLVSMILTRQNNISSRERENVFFSNSFFFSNLWFTGLIFQYQRNLELGLTRRFQQGIGIGRKLILKENLVGTLGPGIVVNQEQNIEGSTRGNLYEFPLLFKLNFFNFSDPNLSISLAQNAFFSLSQKGRFRQDGDLRVTYEIFSDFNINGQFYFNYDNQSAAGSRNQIDFGTVIGLGFKF